MLDAFATAFRALRGYSERAGFIIRLEIEHPE
jgi:hypothetical protein